MKLKNMDAYLSQEEALQISQNYLIKNSKLKMAFRSIQKLDAWIDGHVRIDSPVYAINYESLADAPMDGAHFLTIVVHINSKEIKDVFSS